MAGHVANAEVEIAASPARVWTALVDPALVSRYFFGAAVESDFRPGSRIAWRGEWKGQPYEDHGEILEVVPEQRLRLTHFSPLTGQPDVPENYHTITYELTPSGAATHLALAQDNNASEEEARHSAANWQTMLESIKQMVEQSP